MNTTAKPEQTTEYKYFGPVQARIDKDAQCVQINLARRGNKSQQLESGTIKKLFRWALAESEQYWLDGYAVTIDPLGLLSEE